MNNKILVELHIPTIDKVYEIFIPIGKNIKTITNLIIKSIIILDNNSNITTNMVICDGITGMMINPNLNFKEAGLKNGSKIILL